MAKRKGQSRHQFSTFAGVFTPSILTILGVIMFLRTGFVVGQAGIGGALVILLIAEMIALLTALSLAGIATNTPVKGGGAYFLISRVLGPGFGGSIGLALFFAQALSVPFYILGFTEAFVQSFPALREWFVLIAFATAIALFVINYIGAGWAIRTQYVVMAVLGLSILSFLGGALVLFDPDQLAANWASAYTTGAVDYNFWVVFAIYFPAVTGIMAGVNMSGDLKDPARSLVRGTMAAIGVGAVVYMLEMLLCGGSQGRGDLLARPFEMLVRNALFGTGFLVIGGVFAATLSSAMGSLLGAPRVMQALSRDKVVPFLKPFATGTSKGDEPRRALWLTLVITVAVLAFGLMRGGLTAFDLVAAVVTMFFLGTYGMINLAAFVESFGLNPSFRPRFRLFHWSTSLLGAAACFAVMALVDWVAAIVACVVIGALYAYISRRAYKTNYGDARRGFVYTLVTRNLWRLRSLSPHPKNWRPTFLVLSGNPETRLNLLQYAVWLEAKRGIVSMAEILEGDFRENTRERESALERAREFVREKRLNVYPEVVVTEHFDEGMRVLIQAHSIGPIKPNTVVVGWPREKERVAPYVQHLGDIRLLGKSVLCVVDGEPRAGKRERIDIWWRGRENGSLMLILAHLLTENWEWSRARIRVLRVVEAETDREVAHLALTQLAAAARIDADIAIIVSTEPMGEVITSHSQNADVVFLGFQPPLQEEAVEFYERYEAMRTKVPTMILTSSNGGADLLA